MSEKTRGKGKPFSKGDPRCGRPKGRLSDTTIEIRDFARSFLTSAEYRDNLKQRILNGDAPKIEELLHHYGFGKPKETFELGPNAEAVASNFAELMKRASQRASGS